MFTISEPIQEQDIIPLENYRFFNPKIILTSATAIGIAGWLPDNKRLLITRSTTNGFQAIETFDYIKQETILYAERDGEARKPVWLPLLNSVEYATFGEDHEELLISYGNPLQPEIIAQDIFGLSLASMDEWLMIFSPETGDQPVVWNSQQKHFRTISVNLENLAYSKFGEDKPIINPIPGKTFSIARQPGLKKAVFLDMPCSFWQTLKTGKSVGWI